MARIHGFLRNSTGRIQMDSRTWLQISDPTSDVTPTLTYLSVLWGGGLYCWTSDFTIILEEDILVNAWTQGFSIIFSNRPWRTKENSKIDAQRPKHLAHKMPFKKPCFISCRVYQITSYSSSHATCQSITIQVTKLLLTICISVYWSADNEQETNCYLSLLSLL